MDIKEAGCCVRLLRIHNSEDSGFRYVQEYPELMMSWWWGG